MSNEERNEFRFLRRVFQFRSVRPAPQAEVNEEIDFHLERAERELVAGGMSPVAAKREAQRRFGDIERHRRSLQRINDHRGRRERLVGVLEACRDILRDATRALRGMPGVTVTVILTLALGIGANAVMFGVIDRLLLQSPPHIVDADDVRQVYVRRTFIDRQIISPSMTSPDYEDLRSVEGFADVAAFAGARVTVGSGTDAERVRGRRATPNFFTLLGVQPLHGRFYRPEEDIVGAADVVVLGHDYWMRRYAGDPGVIGQSVSLSGARHRIIGVAPSGFTGVVLGRVDMWLPLRTSSSRTDPAMWEESRGWYWLRAVARIASGVSVQAAAAEATAAHRAGRLAAANENDPYDREAEIVLDPLIVARGSQRSDESQVARWLAGVSVVVLLIACANVANILLAAGMRRRREVGVRLALGVSGKRLLGQLLVESLLLAALGGVVALAIAYWGAHAVRAMLLPSVHWTAAPVNARVLAFTFAAAALTGLGAGLLPAWSALRLDVSRMLSGGARGGMLERSRWRVGMMVLQTTLSVILLVGAGLFVRSMSNAQSVDLGYDPDGVVLVEPEIDRVLLPEEQTHAAFAAAATRLNRLPSVDGVALAMTAPFHSSIGVELIIPDVPEPPVFSHGGPYVAAVTDNYFSIMDVRILEGRGFTPEDMRGDVPVVVVEEALAQAYWPAGDTLGKCMKIGGDDAPCATIVGIAENTARQELSGDRSTQYYIPLAGDDFKPSVMFVRADTAEFDQLAAAIRAAIHADGNGFRYVSMQPVRGLIDSYAGSWRLGASMFTIFGILAVVIAAVGLYGVLAFNVAQRRHEIGVRSALGAAPAGLIRLVTNQALTVVAASLVVGLGVSLLAGRWVEPLLFQVRAHDPIVMVGVVVTLLLVGLVASVIPARRAARVDPMLALREE